MSGTRKVIGRVEALLGPVLEDMGNELVFVEHRVERGGMLLRLYVDRAGSTGIRVDELAQISREIGPILEVEEIINSPYRLEVSSPGQDRPLAKPADCLRFVGKRARIVTRHVIGGRKKFKGFLKGVEGDEVLLEDGDALHRIKWEWVKKANLIP